MVCLAGVHTGAPKTLSSDGRETERRARAFHQIPKTVRKIRTYLSRSIPDPTLSSMPDEPLESGWFYATVPRSGGLPAFLSFGRGAWRRQRRAE